MAPTANPIIPPGPPGNIVPKGITWQVLNVGALGLSAICGESATGQPGIWGTNDAAGVGVLGSTNSTYQAGTGLIAAVSGENAGSGAGVRGISKSGDGVVGFGGADNHAGVSAVNDSGGGSSFGLWARGTPAGFFAGNVIVTGNVTHGGNLNVDGQITVLGDVVLANPQGKDCAEDFEMLGAEHIDPGSVVVIDSEGALKRSDRAYDKRVAGVVSGAGDYKPGIILGREQPEANTMPVALMGRVFCKVDAGYSPIEVGDLLTTSPTPGHAMKADDHIKSFGAVIGKALRSVGVGQDLIPILVALQ